MHDFRLPAQCKWGLCSYGTLYSIDWYFVSNNQSMMHKIPEEWRPKKCEECSHKDLAVSPTNNNHTSQNTQITGCHLRASYCFFKKPKESTAYNFMHIPAHQTLTLSWGETAHTDFLCHRLRIGIKKENHTSISRQKNPQLENDYCTSMSSMFSSLHNFLQITEHFYLKWIQHSLSCDNDLFWLLFHRQWPNKGSHFFCSLPPY